MREIRDYLFDIKIECKYLKDRSKDLDYKSFIKNEELKRAFVRSLEVIGEATKKIPKNFRERYSDVPWREMAGMRDKVIYEYFGVDSKIVWI